VRLRITDNEKIAKFAGFLDGYRLTTDSIEGCCYFNDTTKCVLKIAQLPDYSTDAEAIQLLNTLVKKGYRYELSGMRTVNTSHWCGIKKPYDSCWIVEEHRSSINESILAAVLAVIEKRAQDE